MKPNPHRTVGARLLISVALNCYSPLLANAPHHDLAPQRSGRIEQSIRREPAASAPSGHSVRERTSVLNSTEPRFVRARAYLVTLLQEGYDSQLLDYWLDALGDDTIVEGMPGDLVLEFYGAPLERRSIVFESGRAEMWSIVRQPNRVDRLIVSGGKVVRIGV